jgi:hypothetical protein
MAELDRRGGVESLINKQTDREAKYNQPIKPNAVILWCEDVKSRL